MFQFKPITRPQENGYATAFSEGRMRDGVWTKTGKKQTNTPLTKPVARFQPYNIFAAGMMKFTVNDLLWEGNRFRIFLEGRKRDGRGTEKTTEPEDSFN